MSDYRQLAQWERYTITYFRQRLHSVAYIARILERAPSTISRELRRNRSADGSGYRAEVADRYATARRRRERRGSHFSDAQMRVVLKLVRKDWSPEQISGHLACSGAFSISHETIYRHIRTDRRRGGTLYRHLRIMPKFGRRGYRVIDYRGKLEGKRHIAERPPEAETRLVLGHWEGDTVMGSDRFHGVLTLVERATGFGIIQKISARTAANVAQAAARAIARHRQRFLTLTLDNGTEFHNYKQLEAASSVLCYFATPYHAWERGSNENFNGLLRQYLPKGTSMRQLTQQQCDHIAKQLNERPRKRLGWNTPKESYDAAA